MPPPPPLLTLSRPTSFIGKCARTHAPMQISSLFDFYLSANRFFDYLNANKRFLFTGYRFSDDILPDMGIDTPKTDNKSHFPISRDRSIRARAESPCADGFPVFALPIIVKRQRRRNGGIRGDAALDVNPSLQPSLPPSVPPSPSLLNGTSQRLVLPLALPSCPPLSFMFLRAQLGFLHENTIPRLRPRINTIK